MGLNERSVQVSSSRPACVKIEKDANGKTSKFRLDAVLIHHKLLSRQFNDVGILLSIQAIPPEYSSQVRSFDGRVVDIVMTYMGRPNLVITSRLHESASLNPFCLPSSSANISVGNNVMGGKSVLPEAARRDSCLCCGGTKRLTELLVDIKRTKRGYRVSHDNTVPRLLNEVRLPSLLDKVTACAS